MLYRSSKGQTRAGTRTLQLINKWMTDNKLEVTPDKTEAVLFSGKRVVELINIKTIQIKNAIKYLGVTMNRHLSYNEHPLQTSNKAERLVTALCRLADQKLTLDE